MDTSTEYPGLMFSEAIENNKMLAITTPSIIVLITNRFGGIMSIANCDNTGVPFILSVIP
jgi:hypothetical protein